jgi:glycerol-3-phosphate dehydrogenase (NAD(P)+)
MNAKANTITVLGGGAWGTALAAVAANAGHDVRLWLRDADVANAINRGRMNTARLPGIVLPQAIRATPDLAEALDGAVIVLAATPAQTTRAVLAEAALLLDRSAVIVLCAKGIETGTGLFLTDVAQVVMPGQACAVLSGPGFAGEIARGLPTAVTIAAETQAMALDIATALSTARFRCYASDDKRGVEAGGALKNVIAIAAGAAHGAGLGASAGAALVTRGFAEMKRVALSFGARAETLNGLSGLGDLILTCGSAQSRNFAHGMALAAGVASTSLAEGVATSHVACELAARDGIDAPIITAVAALVSGHTTIDDAVAALMARPLKSEGE